MANSGLSVAFVMFVSMLNVVLIVALIVANGGFILLWLFNSWLVVSGCVG